MQFDDFVYIDAKSEVYEDKANIGFFMGEINDVFNSKMIGFNEEDDFDEAPF